LHHYCHWCRHPHSQRISPRRIFRFSAERGVCQTGRSIFSNEQQRVPPKRTPC